MHSEIWRAVPGFESYYEVSNLGRVRSLDRIITSKTGKAYIKPGRIRKQVHNDSTGYYMMVLCGDRIQKTMTTHRLVALAFLENPLGLECVNHKNEDKHDNRVENLEWCDKAYNNHYGTREKASYKPVIGKHIETGDEIRFSNARTAGAETGTSYKNISACCRGVRKTTGGYEWRFGK
ncbi:MAG: HNH endonuclease [Oscillospiraceae bacterium]|nr:HNH endonuclease [Oscillospiraceae bacterium]